MARHETKIIDSSVYKAQTNGVYSIKSIYKINEPAAIVYAPVKVYYRKADRSLGVIMAEGGYSNKATIQSVTDMLREDKEEFIGKPLILVK